MSDKDRLKAQHEAAMERVFESHRQQVLLLMGDKDRLKAQCAAMLERLAEHMPLWSEGKCRCGGIIGNGPEWESHVRALIPTNYAAALEEHDEQLRQKFSKECARFHEEGRKCVTCGREDIEELKRQARAAAQDEIRIHIGLFMPINDDEEHYQRGVLSIIDALRAEGAKQP